MNSNGEQILGSIGIFAGTYAVRDFSFCNGQLMQISENNALYGVLGTNYGGDGRVTFGLPDLRGRVATGVAYNSRSVEQGFSLRLGQMGGTDTFRMDESQMPSHAHNFRYGTIHHINTGGSSSASCQGSLKVATDGTDSSTATSGSHLSAGPIKAAAMGVSNLYKNGATTFENLDVDVSCSGGGNFDPSEVTIGNTGGENPIQLHQPYTVINYEIALQGVWPARN